MLVLLVGVGVALTGGDDDSPEPGEPLRELSGDEQDELTALSEEADGDVRTPSEVPEDYELTQSVRQEEGEGDLGRVFLNWSSERDAYRAQLTLFQVPAGEGPDEPGEADEPSDLDGTEEPQETERSTTEVSGIGEVSVLEISRPGFTSLTYDWTEDGTRYLATLLHQATPTGDEEERGEVPPVDEGVLTAFVRSIN